MIPHNYRYNDGSATDNKIKLIIPILDPIPQKMLTQGSQISVIFGVTTQVCLAMMCLIEITT